jgi:hypothetical protein
MRRPPPSPAPFAPAILFLGLVLVPGAAGCGGDRDPGGGADAGAGADAADPGDPAPIFERPPSSIEIVTFPAATHATGRLYEERLPEVQEEVARAGACRLLRTEPFYCFETPCTDQLCVGQDQCAPYPPALAAGTLTLRGAGDPVVVESFFPGMYFGHAQHDLAPPGTTLTVEASGGDLPAFTAQVEAPAVAAPALEGAADPGFPPLAAGTDLVLRWSPVDPGSRVRLFMSSDVFHGTPSPAILECDAPDTGELTVAADLVDGFVDPANWGCGECPIQYLTRYRRQVVDVAGHEIEIAVGNRADFYYHPTR